ncbi:small-conductance mechanosensitive channel [Edaphobacter aggregans]|uniref:Small-conductance mechanosensitive channel n=1 Tax=Edaphobacter aggregans TaxID=570835 RepID=A0A428MJC0_9BACT|nr:mechanosensitive ion channel domain-containing protein [Edaphobacter aggregans]RSL16970.1 small-conductance mechanosensitive channel [Edaphobacter aggregans]
MDYYQTVINEHFRHPWFFVVFLFCAVIVVANIAHYIIFRFIRRKESEHKIMGWGIQKYLSHPARAIFFITCLRLVLPAIPRIPDNAASVLRQVLAMAVVIALGWFAVSCVYAFQAVTLRRYDLSAPNNLQARRIHTQFQFFRRILIALIVVVTIGALLWTFNDASIWRWGSGLLASAGVASVILATAARSTAANFFAGLQIAFTDPIHVDDVVVIQGEWGRIEEINSAYVVVKIWDLRRLIVPLSFFIENAFQNWTRDSSDILGTAFLYVDYSIPVEALRQQLITIVDTSPLWDRRTCVLQVTNLSERAMEIRCLTSSRNSSDSFDLRCIVREKMTEWIQQNYPNAFPVTRFTALPDSAIDPQRPNRPEALGFASETSRRS